MARLSISIACSIDGVREMDKIFQISEEDWAKIDEMIKPIYFILDTHYGKKQARVKCTNCGAEEVRPSGYFTHGVWRTCKKCHKYGEIVNPQLYAHSVMKYPRVYEIKSIGVFEVENPDSVWLKFVQVSYTLERKGSCEPEVERYVQEYGAFHFEPGKATKFKQEYDYAKHENVMRKCKRTMGYTAVVHCFMSTVEIENRYIGLERLLETFLKYHENSRVARLYNARVFTELLILECKYPAWTELCTKCDCIEAAIAPTRKTYGIKRRGRNVSEIFPALKKAQRGAMIRYMTEAKPKNIEEIAVAYDFLKIHETRMLEEVIAQFREKSGTALEAVQATGLSVTRLRNYLKKQKRAEIGLYRDYIRECQRLGYQLTDSAVLFPKDLREKHAETSALCRYRVNETQIEKCKKRHKMLVKQGLEVETETLCVHVPEDGKDIIAEGAKLSHCVGGYVVSHAEGVTTILFIRKKSEPETPYFTVEIDLKTARVIQCYGYKNKVSGKNEPQVATILDKLVNKVKQINKIYERQEQTA